MNYVLLIMTLLQLMDTKNIDQRYLSRNNIRVGRVKVWLNGNETVSRIFILMNKTKLKLPRTFMILLWISSNKNLISNHA